VCINCFSSVDAFAVAGSGAAALASGGWQRIVDRVQGRSRRERLQRTWDDDASFLSSLGHDPEVLLGPAPERVDA
jgi:hypothetical protein